MHLTTPSRSCDHRSSQVRNFVSDLHNLNMPFARYFWARIYYNLALAFLAIPRQHRHCVYWLPVPVPKDSSSAISVWARLWRPLLPPLDLLFFFFAFFVFCFWASALCLAITKFVISGAMRRGNLKKRSRCCQDACANNKKWNKTR